MAEQEAVIKPPPARLPGLPGVLGATILPGGRVVVVVNPAVIDEIEAFVAGQCPVPKIGRVLATIVFVDIVASTERALSLGDDGWRDLLEAYLAIARRQSERSTAGRSTPSATGCSRSFDGPARAVTCATTIRDAVRRLGLDVQAGLHTARPSASPASSEA